MNQTPPELLSRKVAHLRKGVGRWAAPAAHPALQPFSLFLSLPLTYNQSYKLSTHKVRQPDENYPK